MAVDEVALEKRLGDLASDLRAATTEMMAVRDVLRVTNDNMIQLRGWHYDHVREHAEALGRDDGRRIAEIRLGTREKAMFGAFIAISSAVATVAMKFL